MNRRYAAIIASLGLAACTTPGPEPAKPVETAESPSKAQQPEPAEAVYVKHNVPSEAVEAGLVDDKTLVCKREKITGSHIAKIVCLTAGERERLQKISQEHMASGKRAPDPTPPEG